MSKKIQLSVLLIAVALFMGVAGVLLGVGKPSDEPPAAEMLPELSGYNTVEDDRLLDYISKLSGGTAMLAGQPELAAAIAIVDQIVGCYQDVGAVRARLYADQEMPLSAGVVAIADRNVLLDPANLFKCVAPAIPDSAEGEVTVRPCTGSYTLSRDDNEFYITYAGTTEEICQAFCGALEGCAE